MIGRALKIALRAFEPTATVQTISNYNKSDICYQITGWQSAQWKRTYRTRLQVVETLLRQNGHMPNRQIRQLLHVVQDLG